MEHCSIVCCLFGHVLQIAIDLIFLQMLCKPSTVLQNQRKPSTVLLNQRESSTVLQTIASLPVEQREHSPAMKG